MAAWGAPGYAKAAGERTASRKDATHSAKKVRPTKTRAIQIYYGDHPPPHFHAVYAGAVAKIDIETLRVIDGSISKRALSLVLEWAAVHQTELLAAFQRAAALQVPGKIAPLP